MPTNDPINYSLYDEALIVCTRQIDLPTPNVPSQPGGCVQCLSAVWVSYSVLARAGDLPVAYICPSCYVEAEAMRILEEGA